ncbi:hypothetical protein DRE_06675 [Drechslerella stenobrocha 248]|uniref:Casein kinase substrate phosphoprotein PP28 domain-containing protein n=1 Tax=Drechslerella stenobrocha 248 TaxID=1043628 RepID=W7HN84_9PEZI|nr:hypothetical protein DRE_06675 [Drechslerella stenobrocha 248]
MRRGKLSKPTRGGGKKFSRAVRPAEDAPGMWDDGPREKDDDDNDEEDSDDESSEEESGDDGPSASTSTSARSKLPVITADMDRDERKAAQRAIKEAKRAKAVAGGITNLSISDDEEEEDTGKAAAQGFPVGNPNAGNVEPTVSRKEREAAEAAAAKERYRKLHEAGKTEEAKSDLARLAIIKKEREEKALQRKAELEEKARQAQIKAEFSRKKK